LNKVTSLDQAGKFLSVEMQRDPVTSSQQGINSVPLLHRLLRGWSRNTVGWDEHWM